MQRRILICLEQLNVGGVETAVLNMSVSLKKHGHKIIILAVYIVDILIF